MQNKKFSLSMKLRAESILQATERSPEKSFNYVHTYSLPKLEQGWQTALRASDEKEERIRKMKKQQSATQLSHVYERLSGLHETELNLGRFPDRGQIIHPTVLCVRCSDPAALCVPCSEQLIQDGIGMYIQSRAKGAAYLFHNAISRSASSTVLRFVIFKIWRNSIKTRNINRLRRRIASSKLYQRRQAFPVFRAWQRFTVAAIAEKKDRKILNLEKRVKQLEEQLSKLATEHKNLTVEHKNIRVELSEEKAINEGRALRIHELEDRVQLDEKKILFLTGFVDPLLQVTNRLNEFYHERLELVKKAKLHSNGRKLITPVDRPQQHLTAADHYFALLEWVNEMSDQSHFNPNIRVRGTCPTDFIPIVPRATSVESLSDGKAFSCVVVALILNSDAIKFAPIPIAEPAAAETMDKVGNSDSDVHSSLEGLSEHVLDQSPPEQVIIDSVEASPHKEAAEQVIIDSVEASPHKEAAEQVIIDSMTESPSEKAPQPVILDSVEESPHDKAMVDALVKFLKELNENRASPTDLISLSMRAASFFLHIPIDDLEDCLALDSITCILYRIVYLRMFTAPVHGYKFTLLPGEAAALKKLENSISMSKVTLDAMRPDLVKLAKHRENHLHKVLATIPEETTGDSVDDNGIEQPRGDNVEAQEVNLASKSDVECVGETEVVKDDGFIQQDGVTSFVPEDAPADVPPEEDPIELLHQTIAAMASSESTKVTTAEFTAYLNELLNGLSEISSIVDSRNSAMDNSAVSEAYRSALHHGFIAQKTISYVQF